MELLRKVKRNEYRNLVLYGDEQKVALHKLLINEKESYIDITGIREDGKFISIRLMLDIS